MLQTMLQQDRLQDIWGSKAATAHYGQQDGNEYRSTMSQLGVADSCLPGRLGHVRRLCRAAAVIMACTNTCSAGLSSASSSGFMMSISMLPYCRSLWQKPSHPGCLAVRVCCSSWICTRRRAQPTQSVFAAGVGLKAAQLAAQQGLSCQTGQSPGLSIAGSNSMLSSRWPGQ